MTDDSKSTILKCPICHVDMEWDELIQEFECPVCCITESIINEMPDDAFSD